MCYFKIMKILPFLFQLFFNLIKKLSVPSNGKNQNDFKNKRNLLIQSPKVGRASGAVRFKGSWCYQVLASFPCDFLEYVALSLGQPPL